MNRKFLGCIFILVGFFQLYLQLCGLIILQFLDKIKDLNKIRGTILVNLS